MRGKAPLEYLVSGSLGITPACAGKSRSQTSIACQCRDHPRLCGEKLVIRDMAARSVGSPPPVRGKEARFLASGKKYRITPACAGKRRMRTDLSDTP